MGEILTRREYDTLVDAGDEQPSVELEPDTGQDDTDYTGWYCVNTVPFRCPAAGCDFVAEFLTAAHHVIVWEERDDPELLRHARRAAEVGRNPRVRVYEPDFGPAIAYSLWVLRGRPTHGIKGEPAGSMDGKPAWW
jgi:hypothetical protein